jgi:hypothetical protein
VRWLLLLLRGHSSYRICGRDDVSWNLHISSLSAQEIPRRLHGQSATASASEISKVQKRDVSSQTPKATPGSKLVHLLIVPSSDGVVLLRPNLNH